MANRLPFSGYTVIDPAYSDTLLDFVQDYAPGFVMFDADALPDGGVPAGDGVFDMAPVSLPGHIVPAFYDDWYFRIHFIPASLDMGNLLSNQTREIVVWNAYFETKETTSFALSGGDGISITEPVATPYNMAPLATYSYVVAVSTIGPPTIDGDAVWLIDGVEYTVPITGRRVVVWSFKPTWSNEVDETLEWQTAIDTSFNRTEQRVEQRGAPRRILEYTAHVLGAETGLFENVMFGWGDRLFAVPLWMEVSVLTEDALMGATSISLPTADRSYEADGLVVLHRSATSYEALEIESVADGVLALKKPLESTWAAGSRAFPVMIARLEGAMTGRYVAEDKIELPVRFVGSPGETPVRLPEEEAALTFEGEEVYLGGTNWISALDVRYEPDFNLLDNTFGAFQVRQRGGWPLIVKPHEWLLKTRVEGTTLRAFFARRKGRLVPVWMPTGTADFKLQADVVLSDAALLVTDNDYGTMVDQHPARKHIIVQLRGGTNIIREIDSYTPQGDGTAYLNLTAALGVGFTRGQVRRISFLGRYRLASDAITFNHKTTAVSVVQSSMQLTRPGS